MSILEWLVETGPEGFVAGVLIAVFGSTALLSEKTVGEKFWLVGRVFRYFQTRKERAADLEETLSKRRSSALWEEIRRVDEARERDRRMFEARIEQLERTEREQHAYILYVTDGLRRIEVWAVDSGLHLPVKILTFIEWLRLRKDGSDDEPGDVEGGSDVADR